VFDTVFFNLGSAEPGGSDNSLLGFLKIVQFRIFRFRLIIINVPKVPQVEKGKEILVKQNMKSEILPNRK